MKNKLRGNLGILLTIDFLIFVFAYTFTLILTSLSDDYKTAFSNYPAVAAITVAVFAFRFLLGVYNDVWRYATSKSYFTLVLADTAGAISGYIAARILIRILKRFVNFSSPSLIYSILFSIFAMLVTVSSRLIYRQIVDFNNTHDRDAANEVSKIGVAIVGAGQIGFLLASELIYKDDSHYKPLCFVDIDREKIGKKILKLDVLSGDDENIIEDMKRLHVQEVFIAIQNLTTEHANHLLKTYNPHFKVKVYDFPIKEESSAPSDKRILRDFNIEDLLMRDCAVTVAAEAYNYYNGKVVLVTGGGGSIGSEICRQIASCSPKQLIILDIYENNAYELEQHLVRKYGKSLNFVVEIASVRDRDRLDAIFNHYRPDVVFHAAAHKHVPLMEHSSCEAVKNNVFGTYNTADMAEKYGVSKFVLISTDKAVNPTNVMGASKRMCEMVIQCRTDSKTQFSAVRFGNVLGSNGSVIPLFKKQISLGGPITITDKRIIRYFMTIPEASQLVIKTGAMAEKGELFVLNMGKPVKILELAENMIKLSGYTPYVDIDIVEVGLRPGEKLYEELLMKSETLSETSDHMIFIEQTTPLTREEVDAKLQILRDAVNTSSGEILPEKIVAAMKEVVPTYHDPSEINKDAGSSEEMKQTDQACVTV